MSGEVVYERSFGTFPLLDVVPARASRSKGELRRVNRQRADRLVVMC